MLEKNEHVIRRVDKLEVKVDILMRLVVVLYAPIIMLLFVLFMKYTGLFAMIIN